MELINIIRKEEKDLYVVCFLIENGERHFDVRKFENGRSYIYVISYYCILYMI